MLCSLTSHTSHNTPTPVIADHSPLSGYRASCACRLPLQLSTKPSCEIHFQRAPSLECLFPYRRKCCLPFVTASSLGVSPAQRAGTSSAVFLPTSPLNNRGPAAGGSRLCNGPRGFSLRYTGMTVCHSKHYLSLSEVSLLIFSLSAHFSFELFKLISESPCGFSCGPKASNHRNYQR